MHHAHTGKILEAPIFYGYSKVNHSVPGVNMQGVRTLQDGLAVMLPLDTDLRSVFFLFLFWGGAKRNLILGLYLNSNLHITSHHTRGGWVGLHRVNDRGKGREGGEKGWWTGKTTNSQAGKQTDGQSIARQGLLSWRHREAKVQSGRSHSIHMVLSSFCAALYHIDSTEKVWCVTGRTEWGIDKCLLTPG